MAQIGQYTLLEQIDEGPVTAVYKAQHTITRQTVALKRLPADLSQHPSIIKKLQIWAIQMQTPPHPGLLPLLGLENHDGQYVALYPYLEGGSLRDKIGSLDLETVNQVLLRLTDILKALHQFNQIHQNIKPENILFDDQGKVFLMDAGLSAIIRPRVDSFSGTPGYMSLEQIEGEAVDSRTDFYSLGILLYEMLAGERPFQAESPARLLVKQATQPLPQLHTQFSHLPIMYDRLIERLSQKDRALRPGSSHEAGDLVVSAIAQIEGWPDTADADYAEGLPIFEHLMLYNKAGPSRETVEQVSARIQAEKAEEERHSQKRMENFMAMEEERQARVHEQITSQQAQERAIYIIAITALLIFVLGLIGYYLTQTMG